MCVCVCERVCVFVCVCVCARTRVCVCGLCTCAYYNIILKYPRISVSGISMVGAIRSRGVDVRPYINRYAMCIYT